MKKILITTFSMLSVFIAFTQYRDNPPQNVRESFQKEYPQSKSTEWVHSKSGWSANFEDKDHNYGEVTAHFDRNGKHLETHIPYDNKDVPAPVMHNVRSKFPKTTGYHVTRIDRSGENSVYQVNLKDRKRNRTVYMDENGEKRGYNATRY